MRKRLWFIGGLAVALALLALSAFGASKMLRQRLHGHPRYAIDWQAIDCPVPPGQERNEFLDEVAYVGDLPSHLHLLDDDLARHLAAAFARHPWVEQVERVELIPSGRVEVQLSFRTPVLVVQLQGARSEAVPAAGRVIDGQGILLPAKTAHDHLPVLAGDFPPPAGPAGSRWGDNRVEAAARLAALLRLHQDRLQLCAFQVTPAGVILKGPRQRVLWGNLPGAEAKCEAAADLKLERLLKFCDEHGGLQGFEYDVRAAQFKELDHKGYRECDQ
jgi:hypothetical protein